MAKKGSKKKPATPATPAPKPKSKSTHAQRRKARRKSGKVKITKVTKETRETRSNPSALAWRDIGEVVIPAAVGYAGTRVLQRVVYNLVQKRWPKYGKFAHALSGALAFGGVVMFGHKVKKLEDYQDGVAIGAGIAAIHSAASAFLPRKYSWLLADCRPEDVAPIAKPGTPGGADPATTQIAQAGDEYSYLEEQLTEIERGGSKATRTVPAPRSSRNPVAQAMAMATAGQNDGAAVDPDLDEMLGEGENVDDLYTGAFAN